MIIKEILQYLPQLLLFLIILLSILYLIKTEKSNVLEWLLFAVTEAERSLGSGTGKLKLRIVYDWFISKFSIFSKFVPFDIFSLWVDIALEEMKILLKNEKIVKYVEGSE